MRVIVSECDDFEDCDVTSSMTSPIDTPFDIFLYGPYWTQTRKFFSFRDI